MKILIASPDPLLTALIRHSLPPLEHNILTCHSESLFCQMYRNQEFAVVVTQYAHPFINGYNLSQVFKQRYNEESEVASGSRPTIFLLSWLQNENIVLSLYESGVDQYFTMPININRLATKIRNLTKNR